MWGKEAQKLKSEQLNPFVEIVFIFNCTWIVQIEWALYMELQIEWTLYMDSEKWICTIHG